jgi:hypothetical protein
MSIAQPALQRPYPVVALAILLAVAGVFAALRMPAEQRWDNRE